MKTNILNLLVLIGLPFFAFSQDPPLNMSLVAHIDYGELYNADLNDCWGYVDETGIEYAIVGTTKGTSIVSLENPSSPVEIAWVPGLDCTWRDIQVFGDYAYVTTEVHEGLLIIDMTAFPQPVINTAYYTDSFFKAHDIFIDAAGYAYILGANRGNGGIIILDVHTDPMHPIEVGEFDNWYCHDAFVQGNLLYGAHTQDGLLTIIDVTDKSNPQLINTQHTPGFFTHNVWVTSNGQYAVTTDEIGGAYLTLYDVSDPQNIIEVDRIRNSPGANIVPHNAFILHDTLIVSSYYTDGITVHSMSRPENLVLTGSFDTYPGQNNYMQGCWGVYPFLPSGLFLATDIQNGFFVIDPQLSAASYFEGLVRDSISHEPLQGITITIENDPQVDFSDITGKFGIGTALQGTKTVTFQGTEHAVKTVQVPFVNGQLILDTIDLVQLPNFPLVVKVVEAGTWQPVIGANVRLSSGDIVNEIVTDGFGEAVFAVYQEENLLETGKWSYRTECEDIIVNESTGELIVVLYKEYHDDFTFDLGWTASSNGSATGFWERVIPFTNPFSSNLGDVTADQVKDCNDYAYVTQNQIPGVFNVTHVVNGTVTLRSPLFDLTPESPQWLHFSTWFSDNSISNDTMKIFLTNANGNKVLIDEIYSSQSLSMKKWLSKVVKISDNIQPTANMQFIVEIKDSDPGNNMLEGGIDRFFIAESDHVGISDNTGDRNWLVYPNPVKEALRIAGLLSEEKFTIFSADGRQSISGIVNADETIDTSLLVPGIWFIQIGSDVQKLIKE